MLLFGKPGFVTISFRYNSFLSEPITSIILNLGASRRSADPMLSLHISADSWRLYFYTVGATRLSVQYCSHMVELERKINHDPGLASGGSHIIMAARKR